MAQNYAFLAFGNTVPAAVGGGAGVTTVTIGTSQTGLPATAVRIWNSGTAGAFILMDTATPLTVTGALANGMPTPQSVAPFVLRTGGVQKLQLAATGTITTTVYVTGGEGID